MFVLSFPYTGNTCNTKLRVLCIKTLLCCRINVSTSMDRMRNFSHWIRSRQDRGLFFIIIILCCVLYGIVVIRPGVRECLSTPDDQVYELTPTSNQKILNHVKDFSQSDTNRNHTQPFHQKHNNPDLTTDRGVDTGTIPPVRQLHPDEIVENPLMIIIVAYLHTGSTYLGRVFKNNPGTFYEFEPLRSLRQQSRNSETAMYLNGEQRKVSGHYIDVRLAAEYVQHMLQCNYQNLDLVTLLRDVRLFLKCHNKPQWIDGATDNEALKRQERMDELFYTAESRAKVQKCLPHLTNTCKRAKTRLIKFIRLRLDSAGLLLKQFPKLKIIHLFRDPRSMMDSQVRKNNEGTAELPAFKTETERMCELMRNDIKQRTMLEPKYPNNVIGFRYEDLARTPVEAIQSLFNFTGVSLTETNVDFIIKTSVDAKTNSTAREAVWRTHMDQKHLDIVNEYCSDVLEKLGYIKYNDISSIRDQDKPTSKVT